MDNIKFCDLPEYGFSKSEIKPSDPMFSHITVSEYVNGKFKCHVSAAGTTFWHDDNWVTYAEWMNKLRHELFGEPLQSFPSIYEAYAQRHALQKKVDEQDTFITGLS